MRIYDLKVRIIDEGSDRYGQAGHIESHKWCGEDHLFLVRFNNRLEVFYHTQFEITKESIEKWEEYSGEE